MSGELIAKLESASEGSRELDAMIWLMFNRPDYKGGVKALEMRGWYDGRGHMILETDDGEEVADNLGIGNVTTSIDAALALAERVLGRRRIVLSIGAKVSGVSIGEADLSEDEQASAFAVTPALAICAALLRASAAEGAGHE